MLARAGVPVGVLMAPIIPGLNDSEIPQVLEAARAAGALSAGYILLRLPHSVAPVFVEWLERTQPDAAPKVLGRVQATRGGQLNCSDWGQRMVGSGVLAEQIRRLFQVFRQQHGLAGELPPQRVDQFRPPADRRGQLRLF